MRKVDGVVLSVEKALYRLLKRDALFVQKKLVSETLQIPTTLHDVDMKLLHTKENKPTELMPCLSLPKDLNETNNIRAAQAFTLVRLECFLEIRERCPQKNRYTNAISLERD